MKGPMDMKWLLLLVSLVPSLAWATCNQASNGDRQAYDGQGNACIAGTISSSVTVAPLTTTNLSGAIAVTGTFQSIQALTAGRKGCLVVNSAPHAQNVFFGPVGSATLANSIPLAIGGSVSCAVGGLGVLTDQISIAGTAGDAFVANLQ